VSPTAERASAIKSLTFSAVTNKISPDNG
jgi:hypothetical protein